VEAFLNGHPEFSVDELGAEHPDWAAPGRPSYLQLLPDRHRTDGFFIARLRRDRP
jgi:16S rRNA (cytosine967-C5)-methyltransferase